MTGLYDLLKKYFSFFFILFIVFTVSCSKSGDNVTDSGDKGSPEQEKDIVYSNSSIKKLQKDLLEVLTGIKEVAPGIKLADRYSAVNRQYARDYLYDLFLYLDLDVKKHMYNGSGQNVYALLPQQRKVMNT